MDPQNPGDHVNAARIRNSEKGSGSLGKGNQPCPYFALTEEGTLAVADNPREGLAKWKRIYDALTETEVQEVLDYIAIMESMRRSRTVPSIWEDEVIAVLAEARENRRARQAFEWESVRRKAERKAAAKSNAGF